MAIGTSLLTRAQSAELAGVTAETITKYEEIGLLAPVEHDGQLMYREGDVRSLFYTREFSSPVSGAQFSSCSAADSSPIIDVSLSVDAATEPMPEVATAAAPRSSQAPSGAGSSLAAEARNSEPTVSTAGSEEAELKSLSEILQDLVSGNYQVGKGEGSQSAAGSADTMQTAASSEGQVERPEAQTPPTALGSDGPSGGSHSASAASKSSQRGTESPIEAPTHAATVLAEFTAQAESISVENRSLREQVEMLREERNWLRKRVEQLEVRSEREQMLLLSENETVRRLVDNSKRKWSMPFRLPWFGDQN